MIRAIKIIFVIALFFFPLGLRAAGTGTSMTSDQAMEALVAGNKRFMVGNVTHPNQSIDRRKQLSAGQSPFAMILSCADSRVPPELIFDQGLGDLFVVRVAGNILSDYGMASIEYGASVLHAPLLVVLGHDRCGAVEATLAGKPLPGQLGALAKGIDHNITDRTCDTRDKLQCATDANVKAVVQQLQNSEPVLAPLIKEGKLKVVGARYNLTTGAVEILK